MQASPSKKHVGRYILCVVLVTLVLAAIKGLIAWLAEIYLHSIPIVGGLLRSLEVVELTNVIIFAILGGVLGAATLFIPRDRRRVVSAIALVVTIPLVFSASYLVRQHLWVEQVATEANIPYAQAHNATNTFLETENGIGGFLGFFYYTTKVPDLPTSLGDLRVLTDEEKRFRSELTRFSGVEPGIFSIVFQIAGIGLRLFYVLLAVVTSLIYFFKGVAWADTRIPRHAARSVRRSRVAS